MKQGNSARRVRRGSRILLAAAAASTMALLPMAAMAGAEWWKDQVGSGNWSNGNDWSATGDFGTDNAGVPSNGDDVILNYPNGTVTLNVDSASLNSLGLESNLGIPTLFIPGNTLTAATERIGTTYGGSINQTGGTNNVSGNLAIASGSKITTGSYTLGSGASLSVGGTEYIGDTGNGTFNQTGGTNTLGTFSWLVMGNQSGSQGTYSLSGTGSLACGTEYLGFFGTGNFNQNGGTNTIDGPLYVGYSGSSGTYTLQSGVLSSNFEVIGNESSGTFNQSGGTNTIDGPLRYSQK